MMQSSKKTVAKRYVESVLDFQEETLGLAVSDLVTSKSTSLKSVKSWMPV